MRKPSDRATKKGATNADSVPQQGRHIGAQQGEKELNAKKDASRKPLQKKERTDSEPSKATSANKHNGIIRGESGGNTVKAELTREVRRKERIGTEEDMATSTIAEPYEDDFEDYASDFEEDEVEASTAERATSENYLNGGSAERVEVAVPNTSATENEIGDSLLLQRLISHPSSTANLHRETKLIHLGEREFKLATLQPPTSKGDAHDETSLGNLSNERGAKERLELREIIGPNAKRRQVGVQTGDDNMGMSVQTPLHEHRDEATQIPESDVEACGKGHMEKSRLQLKLLNGERLINFATVVEELTYNLVSQRWWLNTGSNEIVMQHTSNLAISSGYSTIPLTSGEMRGARVISLTLPDKRSNTLAIGSYFPAFFDKTTGLRNEMEVMKRDESLVLEFDLASFSSPLRGFICEGEITSFCYSNDMGALLAGLSDGICVLWDLKQSCGQRPFQWTDEKVLKVLLPSYDTSFGSVFKDSQPSSTIVAVMAGCGERMISLDMSGTLTTWILHRDDVSKNPEDFGLSPNGRLKLIKASTTSLIQKIRSADRRHVVCCADMITKNTEILAGFSNGEIIRLPLLAADRGRIAGPRSYQTDGRVCSAVDFIRKSPYDSFFAASTGATVFLFHLSSAAAIRILPIPSGSSDYWDSSLLRGIEWSRSDEMQLYVLVEGKKLLLLSFAEEDSPTGLGVDQFDLPSEASITRFITWRTAEQHRPSTGNVYCYMAFALANGSVQIHALEDSARNGRRSAQKRLKNLIMT